MAQFELFARANDGSCYDDYEYDYTCEDVDEVVVYRSKVCSARDFYSSLC